MKHKYNRPLERAIEPILGQKKKRKLSARMSNNNSNRRSKSEELTEYQISMIFSMKFEGK